MNSHIPRYAVRGMTVVGLRGLTLCGCLMHSLQASGASAESKETSMALSPRLSWISKEKVRAGYNYHAALEWYDLAKACGLNAIFSRMEIANEPAGDVGRRETLRPGQRKPDALVGYDLIVPSARKAKELGLHWFYMLDLAASRSNYVDGLRNNPRRHNNGKLFAPTDDIYWTRVVEGRFLRVAEMLRRDDCQVDGFLIDTEMYALHGATPPGLDLGDYALGEFLRSEGLQLDFSELSIEERRDWLDDRGLRDKLERSQFEKIKQLAQRTRERVQAIHPDAIFGFFLWRDSFWFRAAAAGFSTPRTPCVVMPESTYPGEYSQAFLDYCDSVRRDAAVPILLVPGLALASDDPPERMRILPGNLYHRSIRTDGYWFWALARCFAKRDKSGPAVELLQTVNGELDRYLGSDGTYASELQPAPLPTSTPAHLQDTLLAARSWAPVPKSAYPANAPDATAMCLRGLHTLVFHGGSKAPARFTIRNMQLGHYTSPTAVTCYRPDSSEVHFDDIPLRESREIEVDADTPGAWVLAVTSHNNAFRTESGTAVLYSPGPIAGCGRRDETYRYFFYVPKGCDAFQLALHGFGPEKATFRLYRPDGSLALEETDLARAVTREIRPDGMSARVWWLEISDIVEDYRFQLVGIPNIFAARPEHLLASKR